MESYLRKSPKIHPLEREFWLPPNAPSIEALRLGSVHDDAGHRVYTYGFVYDCKCGNKQWVLFVAPEDTASTQIEDGLNKAFEHVIRDEAEAHQRQLKTPNDVSTWSKALKLDVAEELRHIKKWMEKRKWSRQTLWKGAN